MFQIRSSYIFTKDKFQQSFFCIHKGFLSVKPSDLSCDDLKCLSLSSHDFVSPAFIDVHSHSDYFLFLNPKAEAKVQQGVGVEIGGNCGYSAAPIWGPAFEKRFKEYRDYEKLAVPWKNFNEYCEYIKELKPSINYAHLVGH